MSMLVVSGVMIGYICSAVTELVVTFAQDADIVNLHNWSLGSFSGTTWSSVRAACICVTVIFVLVFLMSKPLSAYQLGESYALNLGVNVRLLRIGMVVFSSILSACVVAFAGPISFVGIAVPQLVKKMLGTAEPIWEAVSFWRIKICRAFRDVSWQKRWRLSLQSGRIQS